MKSAAMQACLSYSLNAVRMVDGFKAGTTTSKLKPCLVEKLA
jgi:hypothetical protein